MLHFAPCARVTAMADVECRPREAAVTIVNYINHRNPNISLLALAVRHHRSECSIDLILTQLI